MPQHDPWDLPLEQAVLGALLVNNSQIDILAADGLEGVLYEPLHQRIFQNMAVLAAAGNVTPLTLYAAMKSDPAINEVGGIQYLTGMYFAAPALPDLRRLVAILRDLANRRALIIIGENLIDGAGKPPSAVSSAALTDSATQALLGMATSYGSDRTMSLSEVAEGLVRLQEAKLAGEAIPSLSTGLRRLDDAIGGLLPADHLLVAGRSGAGKTAVACSLGRAAAMSGAPVLAISADMSKVRWAGRTLSELDYMLRTEGTPVFYGRFRGKMSQQEIEHLANAQAAMREWNYDICDEGGIATPRIRSKVRAMANRFKGKQGLLITDFAQKIQAGSNKNDRRRDEDVTEVAYELGDIVKDVGWSALTLAQLVNKTTDSKGKLIEDEPNEAAVRESGGLIQAVDIAFAVHRKAFFMERREPPGRDFAEPPADWSAWNSELQEHINSMQLIGFKNRDDSISKLNMTLFCEMGANAILDERPHRGRVQAQDDFKFL